MIDYVNYSGGAHGSDEMWDVIGREFGFLNHIHFWYKKMNPISSPEHEITYEQYLEGVEQVYRANLTLRRQNIEKYMHLLARNWFQVKNSDAIFAITTLKNNKQANGGTAWAIQMAIDNKKTVFLFEQITNKWYLFNFSTGIFEFSVTPILCKKYAGIGAREINDNGVGAIRKVYEKTIKSITSFQI